MDLIYCNSPNPPGWRRKQLKPLNKHEVITQEIITTELALFMLTHDYPFEAHEAWCLQHDHKPYTPEAITAHRVALNQKIKQLRHDLLEPVEDR